MPGYYTRDMDNKALVAAIPHEEYYEKRVQSLGDDSLTVDGLISVYEAVTTYDIDRLAWFVSAKKAAVAKQYADDPSVDQRFVLTTHVDHTTIFTLLRFPDPLEAIKVFEPFLPRAGQSRARPHDSHNIHDVTCWYAAVIQSEHLGAKAIEIMEYLQTACQFQAVDIAACFPPRIHPQQIQAAAPQPATQPATYWQLPAQWQPLGRVIPVDPVFEVNCELCRYLAATLPPESWAVRDMGDVQILVKVEAWTALLALLNQNDSEINRQTWTYHVTEIKDVNEIPALIELLRFLNGRTHQRLYLHNDAYLKVVRAGFSDFPVDRQVDMFETMVLTDDVSLLPRADGLEEEHMMVRLAHVCQMSTLILRYAEKYGRNNPLPASKCFEQFMVTHRALRSGAVDVAALCYFLCQLGLHVRHSRVPRIPNACTFHDLLDVLRVAWDHGVFSVEYLLATQQWMEIAHRTIHLPALIQFGDAELIRTAYGHGDPRGEGKIFLQPADRNKVMFSIQFPEKTRLMIEMCKKNAVSCDKIELVMCDDVATWSCDVQKPVVEFMQAVDVIQELIPCKLRTLLSIFTSAHMRPTNWKSFQSITAVHIVMSAMRFGQSTKVFNRFHTLDREQTIMSEMVCTYIVTNCYDRINIRQNESGQRMAKSVIICALKQGYTHMVRNIASVLKLDLGELLQSVMDHIPRPLDANMKFLLNQFVKPEEHMQLAEPSPSTAS